jgi:hypothetical protein
MNRATRAAVLKVLIDKISKVHKADRQVVDDELRELYAGKHKVTRVDVELPGCSAAVAEISLLTSDDEAAVAVDQAARLAWVKRNHPDEVVTVEQVRESFAKAIMGKLKYDAEVDAIVHEDTQEVIEWARVVPKGPPTARMTFKPNGAAAIEAAYREGRLPLGELLALEGPDAA